MLILSSFRYKYNLLVDKFVLQPHLEMFRPYHSRDTWFKVSLRSERHIGHIFLLLY